MKTTKIILLAMLISLGLNTMAQVAINIDGSAPDESAILDLKSTDKGFLPPRMNELERDAINSPVAGLVVWCNNCGATGELQVYNGTAWVNMIGGAAASFVCGTSGVTDIDGNTYNTVQIGTQCWMNENLKTTTYNNGTPIPNVTSNSAWSNLTTGAYVWYNNDITWKDLYGGLYNWYATVDPNGLCPSGWHVPTNDEWTALTDYIGGTGSPHGNELKSCRQVNSPLGGGCNTTEHPRWSENNTHYGTDDYGFSGLPGGFRLNDGAFYNIGYYGDWWSSTESSSYNAWGRNLLYNYGSVGVNYYNKPSGFSVRCLRD
ncbi:MAG: fibrobacter succinogenes major paralogous domain-containing protein [Mariniphaga sp.]|nr:fibrobacter succinogenes major paralogous domain-containing protein [Mariniphaga sp.]